MNNDKIKIARIVGEKYPVPPDKGGAIQTSVYYSSLLLKDEFDIIIFSRPTTSQSNDALYYEPIDYSFVEKIAEKILNTKFGDMFVFRFFLKGLINFIYLKKCIKKINTDYDIILIHNIPAFVPIIRSKLKNTKIILSMHNLHLTQGKYYLILKRYYKRALKASNLIITTNELFLHEILKKHPEVKNKCRNIKYGIKTDRFYKRTNKINNATKQKFNLPEDKVIILFAARIVEVKGLHILIDALNLLENKNFMLVIVGSPNFAKKNKLTNYEKFIFEKSESLKANIKYLGFLPQEELALIYSVSDIYVLPTIQPFEGSPQSLLEALATECCSIGDFPEIIKHMKNGLLAESNNINKLSEMLQLAINDEQLRTQLGKNGRKFVEKEYTIEKYSARLANIFKEISNK